MNCGNTIEKYWLKSKEHHKNEKKNRSNVFYTKARNQQTSQRPWTMKNIKRKKYILQSMTLTDYLDFCIFNKLFLICGVQMFVIHSIMVHRFKLAFWHYMMVLTNYPACYKGSEKPSSTHFQPHVHTSVTCLFCFVLLWSDIRISFSLYFTFCVVLREKLCILYHQ